MTALAAAAAAAQRAPLPTKQLAVRAACERAELLAFRFCFFFAITEAPAVL